ncbi:MAG: hypothetical protein ACK5MJ_03275 [Alphaproteobacteria bacterium]
MNKIDKLRDDFEYFAHNILTIRGRGGGVQPLRLNMAQKLILKEVERQRTEDRQVRLIILKGRQMGVSTLIAALSFYHGWRKLGKRGLIMAHRKDAAKNLMHILQHFYKDLPPLISPKKVHQSVEAFNFVDQDSSWQVLTAGANDVGRSESVQFLHASEVAFWPQASEHLTALFATVAEGNDSHIILESTANGDIGAFYDLAMAGEKRGSSFKLLFLPWYIEPSYRAKPKECISRAWMNYKKQHKLSDEQLAWAIEKNASFIATEESQNQEDAPCRRFRQEYPASIKDAFQSSIADGLISHNLVEKATITNMHYDAHAPLILGVDLARGGADESWMISRRGRQLGMEVNEGRRLDDAMLLADWIAQSIEKYEPAKVFLDAGMIGAAVYDRLKQLGFGDKVEAIFFGSSSSDTKRWFNKRAEMWDKMRLWFGDKLGVQICADYELKRQICATQFTYSYNDQLKLEPKDQIKARLGCSPDRADAAALTFALPVRLRQNCQSNQRITEYEPLNW